MTKRSGWLNRLIGGLGIALVLNTSVATTTPDSKNPFHSEPFFCGDHLRKGLTENGGFLSSRRLMVLRYSDPLARDSLTWFKSQISKTLQRALRRRIHRSLLAEFGLQPTERYYWIQQLHLKELNEHLLDVGGTQYYLFALDSALHGVLEANSHLGRLVHMNYKDRVIVSSLEPADFEAQVVNPIKTQTLAYINFLKKESGEKIDWPAFIEASLKWGTSKSSMEESFLDARLRPLNLTLEDWRKELLEIRASLQKHTLAGIDFPETLRRYRRMERHQDLISTWAKRNFGRRQAEAVLARFHRYTELLNVADMLPQPQVLTSAQRDLFNQMETLVAQDPQEALDQFSITRGLLPEAWILHRMHFLKMAIGSRIIISTDLKGLGTHALRDRDAWVERGARLNEITHIYDETSAFLDQRDANLEAALRTVLGPGEALGRYTSGDDGLWSLPDLSAEKIHELQTILESLRSDFYFHIERVEWPQDPHSPTFDDDIRRNTAYAINDAWKALFEKKGGHRQLDLESALKELESLSEEADDTPETPI